MHARHECLVSGIYLLNFTDPVVVLFEQHIDANAVDTEAFDQMKLEIFAREREVGPAALDAILKRAEGDSIYKGPSFLYAERIGKRIVSKLSFMSWIASLVMKLCCQMTCSKWSIAMF